MNQEETNVVIYSRSGQPKSTIKQVQSGSERAQSHGQVQFGSGQAQSSSLRAQS